MGGGGRRLGTCAVRGAGELETVLIIRVLFEVRVMMARDASITVFFIFTCARCFPSGRLEPRCAARFRDSSCITEERLLPLCWQGWYLRQSNSSDYATNCH